MCMCMVWPLAAVRVGGDTAVWTVGKTKTHLYSQSPIATTFAASASETQAPVELQGSGWPWHVREVNVSKKWSSAKGP